jgi:hypothetical protein
MVNQFDIWKQNRGRTQSVVREKPKTASATTPSMLAKYIPALASGTGRVGPDTLAGRRDAWGNALSQMQGVNATTPLVAGAQALGMGLAGYGMGKANAESEAGTAEYRARLAKALNGGSSEELMALANDPYADGQSSALALKMWERNNPTQDQLLQREAAEMQLKGSQFEYDQAVDKADRDEQSRLGKQYAVDKFAKDYVTKGGELFSPEMQMGLRERGIEGVNPMDNMKHDQVKPYIDARDYDKAFEVMVYPPDKGDFIESNGSIYNTRTGQWVENPNGSGLTNDIKNWERTNADRATRNQPPVSFEEYMVTMKKAGASTTNLDMSGGNNKQVFDLMDERYKGVKSAERGITALREAKHAILSGAITGPWADERLFMSKVGAAFGITDPKVIANTEVFRSAMAQQVAAMIKATVGSTQISNTDRQFAEAAAGGQITLDQDTILRLIDLGERANMQLIDDYQQTLDTVYDPASQDPSIARSRKLFTVPDAAPMPGDIARLPQGDAAADAAYDKLRPGAWFSAPDGTIRRKPQAASGGR